MRRINRHRAVADCEEVTWPHKDRAYRVVDHDEVKEVDVGTKELREAFNAASGDAATCTRATLGYERAHDTEWQILTFYGNRADGTPFELRADPIRPNGDIAQAAKETALRLLQQGDKP